MVKRWFFGFAVLAMALQCVHCWGQAPLSAVGLYRNLAGTWIGMCNDFPGSKYPPQSVHLVITIDKNGKAMHWQTTYGVKGERYYDHAKRTVVLDPAKGTVNYDGVLLNSPDLAGFAEKGFGSFSASTFQTEIHEVLVGTFELQPATLTIRWQTTPDGKDYTTVGLFTYKRGAAADTVKR